MLIRIVKMGLMKRTLMHFLVILKLIKIRLEILKGVCF